MSKSDHSYIRTKDGVFVSTARPASGGGSTLIHGGHTTVNFVGGSGSEVQTIAMNTDEAGWAYLVTWVSGLSHSTEEAYSGAGFRRQSLSISAPSTASPGSTSYASSCDWDCSLATYYYVVAEAGFDHPAGAWEFDITFTGSNDPAVDTQWGYAIILGSAP